MKRHPKQLSLFPEFYVRERQPELFPLSHESTCLQRQTSAPERIYVTKWKERNEEELDRHDHSMLETILARYDNDVPYASDRDSIVAASVIQWLGTNVGRCFMEDCENEIGESKRIREPFQRHNHDDAYDKTAPVVNIRRQVYEICAAHLLHSGYPCSLLQMEILNYVLKILREGLPMTPVAVKRSTQRVILKPAGDPDAIERVTKSVQAAADDVQRTMREMR